MQRQIPLLQYITPSQTKIVVEYFERFFVMPVRSTCMVHDCVNHTREMRKYYKMLKLMGSVVTVFMNKFVWNFVMLYCMKSSVLLHGGQLTRMCCVLHGHQVQ